MSDEIDDTRDETVFASDRLCPCALVRRRAQQRALVADVVPVSYTHLDVYKRQVWYSGSPVSGFIWPISFDGLSLPLIT